jgi:hypothetical protein
MLGNHEQGIALTMLVDEDGQPLEERLLIQFLHQVFPHGLLIRNRWEIVDESFVLR